MKEVVDFYCSKYLDDTCGLNGERAVNQRKDAIWSLVDKLLMV